MERRAQFEEREGEFEKAELAIKEFRGAEIVEVETAAKEEEKRAEKKRKKKFDDEVKVGKAKLEQKLKHEKKSTRKEIKQMEEKINDRIAKQLVRKEFRRIETLMQTTDKKI